MSTTTTSTQTRIAGRYGEGPVVLGREGGFDLSGEWNEFMHFLYLPARIPMSDPGLRAVPSTFRDGVTLPKGLGFMIDPIVVAMADARESAPHLDDPYVYVTARRGFASPGNPLNREGWHTDDFGGSDLNYIWSDRWPTRFLLTDDEPTISSDDQDSMRDMARLAQRAERLTGEWQQKQTFNGNARRPHMVIDSGPANTLLRLNPYVIHDTPLIPAPGGMRSFFKISVSTQRYDLLGNSHNYELDYEWPMIERAAIRNQPQGSDRDYSGGPR